MSAQCAALRTLRLTAAKCLHHGREKQAGLPRERCERLRRLHVVYVWAPQEQAKLHSLRRARSLKVLAEKLRAGEEMRDIVAIVIAELHRMLGQGKRKDVAEGGIP